MTRQHSHQYPHRFWSKFSRSAVSLGFPSLRKVFACLFSGESCQHGWDLSVHSFMDLFERSLGNPQKGSGPSMVDAPSLGSLSAFSLPRSHVCPSTQAVVSLLALPSSLNTSMYFHVSLELVGPQCFDCSLSKWLYFCLTNC